MTIVELQSIDSNKVLGFDASKPLVLGRGEETGCLDKRVSRRHAMVTYSAETGVILTALHTNPSFRMPKGEPPLQIIKKDTSVKFEDGDYMGLIPNANWFKVVIKVDAANGIHDVEQILQDQSFSSLGNHEFNRIMCKAVLATNVETNLNGSISSVSSHQSNPACGIMPILKGTPMGINGSILAVSPSKSFCNDKTIVADSLPITTNDYLEGMISSQYPPTISDVVQATCVVASPTGTPKVRRLPAWMYKEKTTNGEEAQVVYSGPETSTTSSKIEIIDSASDSLALYEKVKPVVSEGQTNLLSTSKVRQRLASPTAEENDPPMKKFALEENLNEVAAASTSPSAKDASTQCCGDVNTNDCTLKKEPNMEDYDVPAVASTSTGLISQFVVKTEPGFFTAPNVPVIPVAAQLARPLCQYEHNCYRKNEQHKKDFSHPADADWLPPNARPLCPYDPRCYRRGQAHRVNTRHTALCPSRPPTPHNSITISQSSEHHYATSSEESSDDDFGFETDEYLDEEYVDDEFDDDGDDDYVPPDAGSFEE